MEAELQSGAHKRRHDEDKEKPIIAKTPTELQRLRLEKLMKYPDKPVPIPERPKEKNTPHVPDFVRNVMGSSAGAGSGEFHVYRHLRRKEYARQKFIQEKAEKELRDEEYHQKLEENKKAADERTAKKRAKRLKKKQMQKMKKKLKSSASEVKEENCAGSEESDDDNDESCQADSEQLRGDEKEAKAQSDPENKNNPMFGVKNIESRYEEEDKNDDGEDDGISEDKNEDREDKMDEKSEGIDMENQHKNKGDGESDREHV